MTQPTGFAPVTFEHVEKCPKTLAKMQFMRKYPARYNLADIPFMGYWGPYIPRIFV